MAGLAKLSETMAKQGERQIFPVPPHAPSKGAFDQGIFKKPIAAGTETLDFDRNDYNPEEIMRFRDRLQRRTIATEGA